MIAESGLNDPKVMRDARARRLGLRRRLGRRLPPRAARAADRRPRGLVRASSARSATLAKAFHRPHVHDGTYSTFRRRRFGAPRRRRRRPSASSSSPPTTTRSATARSATGCRSRRAPLAAFCTLLSPFTPMLFQGEEYGERAPFQFFSDHIDEEIADRDARGPPARVRRLRRVRGEEVPDPQDPATFERSKLTRERRAGRPARRSTRELLRAAPRAAAGRRRRDRASTSTPAGCACAAAPYAAGRQLRPRARRTCRCERHRRGRAGHARTPRSSPASSSCRRCPGRCCD